MRNSPPPDRGNYTLNILTNDLSSYVENNIKDPDPELDRRRTENLTSDGSITPTGPVLLSSLSLRGRLLRSTNSGQLEVLVLSISVQKNKIR